MAQTTEAGGPATPGRWLRVLSYLLSALPAAGLLLSAFRKLAGALAAGAEAQGAAATQVT